MDVDLKDFFLRPMQSNDDTKKLSLGDSTFTPLKTFLVKDAWDFHVHQIAKTYVLIQNGSVQIWGYISLVNSEASLADDQRPEHPMRASRYLTFPAVKIARLAVDIRLQGRGFGRMLVGWAVNHIRTIIMPHVGCRFIVVDSKRTSVNFYERMGFVLVGGQNATLEDNPKMFFDLAKIDSNGSSMVEHPEHQAAESST